MIICPNCGMTMNNGAKFCDECGTALVTEMPKINMFGDQKKYVQTIPGTMNTINNINKSNNTQVASKAKALGIVSLIFGGISIITFGAFCIPQIIAILCGVFSRDSLGKITKAGKCGMLCGIIAWIIVVFIILFAIFV